MEDTSNVATAIPTNYFRAMSTWNLMTINSIRNLIIETVPTAMAFDLVGRPVERCIAASANKRAFVFFVCVFTAEWRLSALTSNDP